MNKQLLHGLLLAWVSVAINTTENSCYPMLNIGTKFRQDCIRVWVVKYRHVINKLSAWYWCSLSLLASLGEILCVLLHYSTLAETV